MIPFLFAVEPAFAFCTTDHAFDGCHGHETITAEALPFLLPEVVLEAQNGNHAQDSGVGENDARRHMTSCAFDAGSGFINEQYALALASLDPNDPDLFLAAEQWGAVLHPVQDFYAHSNWAELFDVPSDPFVNVDGEHLLDDSATFFRSFAPLALLRDDIVIGTQPAPTIPFSASLASDSAIPTVVIGGLAPTFTTGTTPSDTFRGLLSGWNPDSACLDLREGTTTDQYGVDRSTRLAHGREDDATFPCADDYPTSVCLNKDDSGRPFHEQAFTYARLQTQTEWCRLLSLTRDEGFGLDSSSILMALAARPGASPHPAHTACAPAHPGPIEVEVTVDALTVDHPTVVPLSGYTFSLYTADFGQSASAAFFDLVGADAPTPPEPLTLCVYPTDTVVATVWGWDEVPFGSGPLPDFVFDLGPEDTLIRGATITIDPNVPDATLSAAGGDLDLVVHVRKNGTSADDDGLSSCAETFYGTSDSDPDTDDDGLDDGVEIELGLSPLRTDTDDDGLSDHDEVLVHFTDPLDPDCDDDGVPDGGEILGGTDPFNGDTDGDHVSDNIESSFGSYGNDPDTDDDGLMDGDELDWGTNLLVADTDGDRLLDGWDPDWVATLVLALPTSAFRDPRTAGVTRTSLASTLTSVGPSIQRGDTATAVLTLDGVSAGIPGCAVGARERPSVCDAIEAVKDNVGR